MPMPRGEKVSRVASPCLPKRCSLCGDQQYKSTLKKHPIFKYVVLV